MIEAMLGVAVILGVVYGLVFLCILNMFGE